jgi:hypothetical protein
MRGVAAARMDLGLPYDERHRVLFHL